MAAARLDDCCNNNGHETKYSTTVAACTQGDMSTITRACSPSYLRQREPDRNGPSAALCHGDGSDDRRRLGSIKQQSRRVVRSPTTLWPAPTLLMWAFLFVLLVGCCPGASAQYVAIAKPLDLSIPRTELLFDRSVPAQRVHIAKRQDQEDSSLASASFIPAPTTGGQASSSLIGSTTLQTATPDAQDDLPRPFDSSLGNNFTVPSCPAFFRQFLSNTTVEECLPFSLLLQVRPMYFRHEHELD